MPRPPRPLGAGCTYHVTARGNNRQAILRNDTDGTSWLELLDQVGLHRKWSVAAYCLMTNHLHVVLTTPRGDLDAGMRDLLSRYARRHNRDRGATGHLFGERYHATLVETDSHLRAAIRYVARNPVDAGLVEHAADWPWSSHGPMIEGSGGPACLDRSSVLGLFHPLPRQARRALDVFVDNRAGSGTSDGAWPTVATLVQALGTRRGVRAAAQRGYTHREIAEALGLSRSAVTKQLSRRRSSPR